MANFLRIGDRIVNLDLVGDILITKESIAFFLTAPDGDDKRTYSRSVHVKGPDAEAVRAWIEQSIPVLAADGSVSQKQKKLSGDL